jgi:hypothetical protein
MVAVSFGVVAQWLDTQTDICAWQAEGQGEQTLDGLNCVTPVSRAGKPEIVHFHFIF